MESLIPPFGQGAQVPDDRRGADRRDVHYLRLFSPIPAIILDLSRRGLALEAMVGMRAGTEYRLRIRHRQRVISLVGEARWCQPYRVIHYSADKSVSLYRVGIELSRGMGESDFDFLSHIGGDLRQVP